MEGFLTPSAQFRLYDPEQFTNPELSDGDYIRIVVRAEDERDLVLFTGVVTAVGDLGEVIAPDHVDVKALGLSYEARQNFPIVQPIFDVSIQDAINRILTESGIIDFRFEGTLAKRLPFFEMRGLTNVLSMLETLTTRTQGLPSHVREDRLGRLVIRDDSAYDLRETPYELTIGRGFRVRRRNPTDVRQVLIESTGIAPIADGSVVYSQAASGRVLSLDTTGFLQAEVSFGEDVWVSEITQATYNGTTGVTSVNIELIDAHTARVVAVGRADADFADLVIHGIGYEIYGDFVSRFPDVPNRTGTSITLNQYFSSPPEVIVPAAVALYNAFVKRAPDRRRFEPFMSDMSRAELAAVDQNALVSAHYGGEVLTGRILRYNLRLLNGIWTGRIIANEI